MPYVGAPYNFIPFPERQYMYDSENLPSHDAVCTETGEPLFSGEIRYHITAKTPVFVGQGKGNDLNERFYRNAEGKYAIPGSTIRGLVRGNVQILSMSDAKSDIDNYSLMFRRVGGKRSPLKDRYAAVLGARTIQMQNGSVSVLDHVRAGYVRNINGNYYIYDTVAGAIDQNLGSMNYYALSERAIADDYQESRANGTAFQYSYLYSDRHNMLQHEIKYNFIKDERYNPATQREELHYFAPDSKGTPRKNWRGKYTDVLRRDYKPFEKACSYRANGRRVISIGGPDVYPAKGVVVSTGKMQEKKVIYVIPAIDESEHERNGLSFPIEIPEKDVKAFQIDLNRRETALKQFGGRQHFDLPEEGKTRPVFYIWHGGRLYFGFTPRLRLFYDYQIHDGIPGGAGFGSLDYARAMFGFSTDSSSYKSRVSFSDAVLEPGSGAEMKDPVHAILAEPKPTSYLDYVDQGKDYNTDGFRLRGIKVYWLREKGKSEVPEKKLEEKYVSHLMPLTAGSVFSGKVRYHNLTSAELGLLLWAIRLNGSSWMNIGKGKAFGYGNISLELEYAKHLDPQKAYSLSSFCMDPWVDTDVTGYIDLYKAELKGFLDGKDPENIPSIKTLFLMKDPERMPAPDTIRYMDIDAREYQSRTRPLPTAMEVLGEKPFYSSGTADSRSVSKEKRAEPIAQKTEEPIAKPRSKNISCLETGRIYSATVTGYQGKKIKFKLEDIDNFYSNFDINHIRISGMGIKKNDVKNTFPIKKKIKVQYKGMEGDTMVWECVEISGE